MASKEPFIVIPRSIFEDGAWKRASLEQKGALMELIIHAAYEEFDYNSQLGNVHVGRNQLVTSLKRLAESWKITIHVVRSIINYWKTSKLIDSEAIMMSQFARQSAQHIARCTLLTVNGLYDFPAQQDARQAAQEKIKKKNIKKKKSPKPPEGADFSLDFSSEEMKRCKEDVKNLRKQLADVWRKIMEDRIWPNDYHQYMPSRRAGLCSTYEDKIKNNHQIPAIHTFNQRQAYYFLEFHLCDFIDGRNLRHTLTRQAIDSLTSQMLALSADLTIAQIPLFFYLLDKNSPIVGPPQWNGTITAELINAAFGKYVEWVKK